MHIRVCLHKFLGDCPGCTVDLDVNHHPNNYDCPGFKPVLIIIFEVKNDKEIQPP